MKMNVKKRAEEIRKVAMESLGRARKAYLEAKENYERESARYVETGSFLDDLCFELEKKREEGKDGCC
jgi:hypothetical protein